MQYPLSSGITHGNYCTYEGNARMFKCIRNMNFDITGIFGKETTVCLSQLEFVE